MLQKMLEKKLEKKAGRNYGPPGNKTLIYFIDDMNMPEVSSNYYQPSSTSRRVSIDTYFMCIIFNDRLIVMVLSNLTL